MRNLFKQMVRGAEIPYAVKHNGLRFRTFHVVKEDKPADLNRDPTGREIGRVTAAFWPKGQQGQTLDESFGVGKPYEVAFSFCAGLDLPVFDHNEGEVRAFQRLNSMPDIISAIEATEPLAILKAKMSGRARHEFIRDGGFIKNQLKLLVLVEAARRGVPWMKGVVIDDLK